MTNRLAGLNKVEPEQASTVKQNRLADLNIGESQLAPDTTVQQYPPVSLAGAAAFKQYPSPQPPAVEGIQPIADPQGIPPTKLPEQPGVTGIGFVESAKEEFSRPSHGFQYMPISGGFAEAGESMIYLSAANRLKQPDYDYNIPIREEPTSVPGVLSARPIKIYSSKERDQKMLEEMFIKTLEQQERGYTFGGKVAKGLLNLPVWMIEFGITGGLANLGSTVAQNAGEKLLRNYAKTTAGKLVLKGMGWTGGAITRASLGLTPRIAGKAATRQVQAQILGADQEGWATSFAKAWGDVTIEAASETAGEAITGIPVKLLSKTKFGSKFINSLRNGWMKATGGTSGEFARQLLSTGGYSNIIGEYGEERLGSLLRALTDTDDFGAGKEANVVERLKAAVKQDMKLENIAVEFTVLGVPMAGQVAAGAVTRNIPPISDILKQEPVQQPNIPAEGQPASQEELVADINAGLQAMREKEEEAKVAEKPVEPRKSEELPSVPQEQEIVQKPVEKAPSEPSEKKPEEAAGGKVEGKIDFAKEAAKMRPLGAKETVEKPRLIEGEGVYLKNNKEYGKLVVQSVDFADADKVAGIDAQYFITAKDEQGKIITGRPDQFEKASAVDFRDDQLAPQAEKPKAVEAKQPQLTFAEKAEALKKLHKEGKITTAELGKRISELEGEPTAKVKPSSENTLLERWDEGEFDSIEDLINEIQAQTERQEDLPKPIQKAIADYWEAVKVDRYEFGMRSGFPEEAEEDLLRVLAEYPDLKPSKLAKEPWEMTRGVWKDKGIRSYGYTPEQVQEWDTMATRVFSREAHKMHVEQALSENKPVPPEVLAEYPDLKPLTQDVKKKPVQKRKVYYRGTTPDRGKRYKYPYFTADKEYAAKYAGKKGEIQEAHIDIKNPFRIDARYMGQGEIVLDGKIIGFYRDLKPDAVKKLKAKGYDGIVVDYTEKGKKEFEVIPFDESQVKPSSLAKEPTAETEGKGKGKAVRFEEGKKLSKEQKTEVLKSIGDSYKDLGAPKVSKGVDREGEEIVGYVYNPDYMYKSDITGRNIRHYIMLPDGRKAHPTELFPNIKQSDVDKAVFEAQAVEKQKQARKEELLEVADMGTSLQEANRVAVSVRHLNRDPNYEKSVVLQKGDKFIRVISDSDVETLKAEGFTEIIRAGKKIEPTKPVAEKKKEKKKTPTKRIAQFRRMADTLDKQIEDKRREMTQNPTPKRMREYNSRLHDADNLDRLQKALRAMADAMESGTLPAKLEGITKKADIQSLVYKGVLGGGYYNLNTDPEYRDKSTQGKLLQDMIEAAETPEQKAEAAKREKKDEIKKAEEAFRFLKIKGFFPTPKRVIDEMMERAYLEEGQTILEPSAGKGDIADALKEAGYNVVVIEVRPALQNILEMKGHEVVGDDFLEHADTYDRILMNPPFEGKQDIDHVQHAYKLLNPGGRLVAIMGEGAFGRSQKKDVAFREWLAEVGGISERLENAFKGKDSFKQTGVTSRIVEITKREADQ